MWVDMWSSVECGGVGSGGVGSRTAPCARGKHSATLLGGYVYVLGGRGSGGSLPLRDFWRYCLATGEWERLECRGEPPPALQEHTATAHETRLYIFGGEAGSLNTETPLWSYDTELQIWRKLAGQHAYTATLRRRTSPRELRAAAGAGPRGRRGHSAHALKDCLLVYGGYKDLRGSTNELWAFHYESESWHQVRTANTGPARHRHAGALHADRLYVHGGQCDLRECADLWHYDTMSRVWTQVRTPAKLSPSARSGHAGLRAGAHLYIFGGEAHGHATKELRRFHIATETWERIVQSLKWPSARVDACALLVPAAPARVSSAPARAAVAQRHSAGLMREISKLSSFHIRRAARCSYSVLAADRDSTESLVRHEAALAKSRSAYAIDADRSPRAADTADITRDPVSVPDFAARVVPDATRLVYFDSDEEEDMRREAEREAAARRSDKGAVVVIPKSASVRFTKTTGLTDEEDTEMSTSDYASAERVNGLSGASLGFSNPHYLGPDVRALGAALTPDSGVGAHDIELTDLGERRARSEARARRAHAQLHLLLVGGKEPPHLALLQSPISMWSYQLL